jgi:hypothetical protein
MFGSKTIHYVDGLRLLGNFTLVSFLFRQSHKKFFYCL